MSKILSVEELIKNKVSIEQADDKVIESTLDVPRLGGEIKLSFTKEDVRDFLSVTNDPKITEEQIKEAGETLIYSIVQEPNLKDAALQKAYECEVPTDIVHKVFNDGEQIDIAQFATKKAGFVSGSVVEVEEIKN